MSYARFSEGDVYVYDNGTQVICSGCNLRDDDLSYKCTTAVEMLSHVNEHIEAGHTVPGRAVKGLCEVAEAETTRMLWEARGALCTVCECDMSVVGVWCGRCDVWDIEEYHIKGGCGGPFENCDDSIHTANRPLFED